MKRDLVEKMCNHINNFLLTGDCAFIDAEHTLDIALANAVGIQKRQLLIEQPNSGEQALNYVDQFIRSGTVDVLVVDSVRLDLSLVFHGKISCM